jgi:hypothetical protein
MYDVVLFADSSLTDNEEAWNNKERFGDIIFEIPTKSAGPYRIASEVRKQGYTCQIVHLCFYFSLEEIQELCKKFIGPNTLAVGLSTTFWNLNTKKVDHRRDVLKSIFSHCRKFQDIKVVLGGTMSGYYAGRFRADASFGGFSEGVFIKYLNALKNKTELPAPNRYSITNTPEYDYDKPADFNFNHSQIRYEDNDCVIQGESKVIEIARGCIFNCDFCSFPLNGKKKLDYIKDEETLRSEFIENYEKFGIQNYTLSDDTFNDSTYKLEYMHKILTTLPFKVRFVCYLRLDLLHAHREQISLLKEMGLVGAFFGVETFNHASGKAIGKGLDPLKQKELLYDLKKHHWKNDVNVTLGMISGLPFETMKSHQETIDWILNEEECLIDRIRPAPLVVINPLLNTTPYNSQFQINASKHGFYWPDKTSNAWKNMLHEVKSFQQATDMSQEIYKAARSRNLTYQGNFLLPLISNISKYDVDPKTLEDLVKMDKVSYTSWYLENRQRLITAYVEDYKKMIMSL